MLLTVFSVLTFLGLGAQAALFSSTEDLKKVTQEHTRLVFDLSRLVKDLESDLAYVRRKLRYYSQQQVFIDLNPEKFSSNPLSAFTLIRTLTSDTLLIQNKLQKTVNDYVTRVENYTPKLDDLLEAVAGFSHLQETYNLNTADLAEGIVQDKKYSDGLTAHDLFEIGRQLVNLKRFSRSIEYLKLALNKTVNEHESEIFPSEILLNIVEASEKRGDIKTAVRTLDEVIHLEPDDDELLDIKDELLEKLVPSHFEYEQEHVDDFETALTRAVCSGKLSKSPKDLAKLRCRLVLKKGFSMLAPFKLEEANLHPYIVIFHDVIYKKKIEPLKRMAAPALYQALTVTSEGEFELTKHIRISKVAWFRDYEEKIVEKISKITQEMTGLTIKTAEPLQIQQYGIGGFYRAHYDVRPLQPGEFIENGERIATTLFYLSDVEKGGATVFPLLKLKIPVEQGSAAFWHNLLPSGEIDHRTLHSGCPVLVGSKWVANKWIHEQGQERRRPCDLSHQKNDEEELLDKFRTLFSKGEIKIGAS